MLPNMRPFLLKKKIILIFKNACLQLELIILILSVGQHIDFSYNFFYTVSDFSCIEFRFSIAILFKNKTNYVVIWALAGVSYVLVFLHNVNCSVLAIGTFKELWICVCKLLYIFTNYWHNLEKLQKKQQQLTYLIISWGTRTVQLFIQVHSSREKFLKFINC